MKFVYKIYPDVVKEVRQLSSERRESKRDDIRYYFLIFLNVFFLFFYSLFVLFIAGYLGIGFYALIIGNSYSFIAFAGAAMFIVILGMMLAANYGLYPPTKRIILNKEILKY